MLSIENTVVLVVDIQERLRPALYQNDDFVAHCVQFLTGANDLKLPIIVTEQYPKGLGKTLPEIQAQTTAASVFEKTRFSGSCQTARKCNFSGLRNAYLYVANSIGFASDWRECVYTARMCNLTYIG